MLTITLVQVEIQEDDREPAWIDDAEMADRFWAAVRRRAHDTMLTTDLPAKQITVATVQPEYPWSSDAVTVTIDADDTDTELAPSQLDQETRSMVRGIIEQTIVEIAEEQYLEQVGAQA